MSCLCKQCRSRPVGFWRSQLIWICTVCHKYVILYQHLGSSNLIGLKIRSGCGILIYSAGQGLKHNHHSIRNSIHVGLDNSGYQVVFLFLEENICYEYSLEVPHQGAFNEYPQHTCIMFSWRKRNIDAFCLKKALIKRCDYSITN